MIKTNETTENSASPPSLPQTSGPVHDISPMEAAIAVRDSLRGTLLQTINLIAVLKRQKKQSRIVKSTLDSLKQLQSVA